MEAGSVMEARAVVARVDGGASRIELPWRCARDHAADNGADLRDLLMALSVPEVSAARDSIGTNSSRALASTRSGSEQLVAVQVVPRAAIAQARAFGAPPARLDAAAGTRVVAGEAATELGVAVAAHASAFTALASTRACRRVRADGPEHEVDRIDGEGGPDDGRADEHASSARARRENRRGLVHQPAAHPLSRLPSADGKTVATSTQRYTQMPTSRANGSAFHG